MIKRIALLGMALLAFGALPAVAAETTGNGSAVGPGPGANTNTNTGSGQNRGIGTETGVPASNDLQNKDWSDYDQTFIEDWRKLTPGQRQMLLDEQNPTMPPGVNNEFVNQWGRLSPAQRTRLGGWVQNPLNNASPDEMPSGNSTGN